MKTRLREKSVSLKTAVATVLFISLLVFAGAYYIYASPGNSIIIEPASWMETAEYVVSESGGTFYRKNGATGEVVSGTNDTELIQYAVDQTSPNGGLVFVKSGSYSASITLKDNVTLILDKGATGVTVSIGSGATAYLKDYENGLEKYWVNGSLTTVFNMETGLLETGGLNVTNAVTASASGKKLYMNRFAGPASYTTGGFNHSTGLTVDLVIVQVEGGGEYIAQVVQVYSDGNVLIKVRDNIEQEVNEGGTKIYTIGGEVASATDLSAVYFYILAVGT